MRGEPRSFAERDDQGFVDLEGLRAAAIALPLEHFVALWETPTLVSPAAGGGTPEGATPRIPPFARREISHDRTMLSAAEDETPSSSRSRGLDDGRVAPIRKRPGNPFPNMVSVGRARSNDIVFLVPTVSKLQGYFRAEEGTWLFTDQRSSNGTMLGGTPLDPGRAYTVGDGDLLRFGLELEVTFLLPATLHGWLRRTAPEATPRP